MNNVMDVANYVIKYHNERKLGITHSKLQRLLYYIQINFLVKLNKPCFEDEIVALHYGPVVPRVLMEFRQYGASQLKYNNYNNIRNENLILEVLEIFKNYTASQLVDLTHKQAPYRDVYNEQVGKIITHNILIDYFKSV